MAKIKLIALLPLLAFGLPQSEGQVVSVEKKQADEMIEAGYAKVHTGKDVETSPEVPVEEPVKTE
jgi:hypothetical protein